MIATTIQLIRTIPPHCLAVARVERRLFHLSQHDTGQFRRHVPADAEFARPVIHRRDHGVPVADLHLNTDQAELPDVPHTLAEFMEAETLVGVDAPTLKPTKKRLVVDQFATELPPLFQRRPATVTEDEIHCVCVFAHVTPPLARSDLREWY